MTKEKMKKQRNVWRIIAIILITILIFIVTIQNPKKDKEIEYQKTCIDNCISEFETCLDNVTLYNLDYGIKTTPQDSKILSCLWDENWCVENCQIRDYEFQKAMGNIK